MPINIMHTCMCMQQYNCIIMHACIHVYNASIRLDHACGKCTATCICIRTSPTSWYRILL